MTARLGDVLDGYEVIGTPLVTATGLSYVPWIDQAVAPYTATRLPTGSISGLSDALRRARLTAA